MSKLHPLIILALVSMAMFIPIMETKAMVNIDDGSYSIEYKVLQASNDSVSIANDYFIKPATLTVDKGKQYIMFTVKQSEWVKVLKAAAGKSFVDVDVVQEDLENDTRTVKFKVDGELSQPVLIQMHIHIASMQPVYDHQHTARFAFDVDSLQEIDPPLEKVEDVATGNKILMYVFIALFIVVAIFFVKKRSGKKQ